MRVGFIKTRTGVSRDNKTISCATSADRSIVSRNALPSFHGFSFSSPSKPFFTFLAISSARLVLFASSYLRVLNRIYLRIRGWNHPLSVSFPSSYPPRSFLFDRVLVNIHTSTARDLFVKSTHPSRRREKEKLKPSLLAYPSLWSLGVTANPRAFPGEARRFVHIRVRFAWKLFGS